MDLVIRIDADGQPYGNPIFVSHMRQAFKHFTTNPLSEGYSEFVRREPPLITEDFTTVDHVYGWENDVVTDVYTVRPMTEEEKQVEISARKALTLGPGMIWDEETLNWKRAERPPIPETGGPYKFNIQTWAWEESIEPPVPGYILSQDGKRWVLPNPRPQDGKNYRLNFQTLQWEVQE